MEPDSLIGLGFSGAITGSSWSLVYCSLSNSYLYGLGAGCTVPSSECWMARLSKRNITLMIIFLYPLRSVQKSHKLRSSRVPTYELVIYQSTWKLKPCFSSKILSSLGWFFGVISWKTNQKNKQMKGECGDNQLLWNQHGWIDWMHPWCRWLVMGYRYK